MKPVVDNLFERTWMRRRWYPRWIRSYARDTHLTQKSLDFRGEPGLVARLEHDLPNETVAQLGEKQPGSRSIVREAGWQLNENRAQLSAQTCGFVQKALQIWNGANKSQAVSDRLWQLYRKLEIVGNRRSPTLVSSSSMWAVKARIDFYTVEQCRVPLQVGSKRREAV